MNQEGKKNNPLVWFSVFLIRKLYKKRLSEKYKKRMKILCRFYPSCSDYGVMALEKYGFLKGWIKTIDRIRRCNPYNCESCIDFP
jgi:hypothetical protein